MTDKRTPVPVNILIDHVVEDGGSYDDGLGGWSGGAYDSKTGVLTIHYERDEQIDSDPKLAEEAGFIYDSATYRFQLLPN